jgi:DNA transformation protein
MRRLVVQDRPVSGLVDFVLDQLADLGDVRARAMFGGHGLYLGPVFFGIVYDDRLYLRTDEETRRWYQGRGMGSFRPSERQHAKSYFEVPADTIEDRAELVERASAAIESAG